MKHQSVIYLTIFIIFAFLIGFLIKCQTKKYEPLCLCSGAKRKSCGNYNQLIKSYEQGLTEYSDLAKIQKKNGGSKWLPLDYGQY